MTAYEIAFLLAVAATEPTTGDGIAARDSAVDYFESHEETCMGWDGVEAQERADRRGICRYFELQAEGGQL